MSSWSKKRRIAYLLGAFIAVVLIIGLPTYFVVYKAPTCFDGIKNGDEQGVDCGGSCQRLCQSAFLAPNIAWTRLERIAPGIYNVGTYIINPNSDGEAKNVPYHIALYDKDGFLVKETDGSVTLPPHRNTLAFLTGISTAKSLPIKALFEFTAAPVWFKSPDPLSKIQVLRQNYNEDNTSSSLVATLQNNDLNPIGSIAVSAILYDGMNNVLGFSRTYVDGISGQGTALAPFTWPMNHQGKVVSIEVLPVAE